MKDKGNIEHTYRTDFDHLLGKNYPSMECGDLWMGITLPNGGLSRYATMAQAMGAVSRLVKLQIVIPPVV